MGETPKSKKGKKSHSKTSDSECITLSSDEDEPMEIPKKTLDNKSENDSITLSSDEEMEFEALPKEAAIPRPITVIDLQT